MIRPVLTATLVGGLALLVLWAFISYLDPAFTGEVATLLYCN